MLRLKKQSDEARTAIASALNSIACLVSFVVSFLFIPITSRILPTVEMGRAVSFATTREMIFVVMSLALTQSVSIAMIDYKERKGEYMSSLMMLQIFCVLVLFSVALIFKGFLLPLFWGSEFLFYWFFLMMIFQAANEIMIAYISFHNRYILSFIWILTSYVLTTVLATIFVMNMNADKFIGRIVGMDSFLCAVGVVSAAIILIKGRLHFKAEYIRYALKVSLPLVPFLISALILVRSDVVVISRFSGDNDVGVYSMAFTIANLLFAVLFQIMKNWSPWVYRKLESGEQGLVKKNSKHIIVLIFFAGIMLIFVSPEVVALFIDRAYYDCVYIISPIVLGMYMRVIGQMFYDVEYYHKKNVFIAIASSAAAILNVALNVAFIGRFGYGVCAVTTALCYGLLAIAHYIYVRSIEPEMVYDMRRIYGYTAAIVALGSIVPFVIELRILRYCILVVAVVAMLIIERDYFAHVKIAVNAIRQRRHVA